MTWLAAALLASSAAVAILRLMIGAVWLHRRIQRDLAPAWARRRGAAVPEAVVDIILRGGEPRQTWIAKGAPLDDLPEPTSRHLPEVHRLLRWLWRAGWAAGLGSVLLGARNPGLAARRAGAIAVIAGAVGLFAAVAVFPRLWSLYHRLAYANDDWQLPDDVLLAALYPERFYQRAAAIWFGSLAVGGLGILAASALGRGAPRGG
jgi:hypothetical protein